MKNSALSRGSFFIGCTVCLLAAASCLFAAGKKDEAELKTLNDTWTLCITAFDTSALLPAQRVMGDVITRSLIDTLDVIQYRIRISPEYAYYEGYAWAQAVNAAAKALAAKQDERTLLLYRGEKNWRYRQNLKKVEADIAKLREEFEQKEAEKPLINREPDFMVTPGNREGNYPEPPVSGGEYRFCQNQKADAFLSGSIMDYHGRYFISLRLYALYTRSVVYEDSVIFSADDIDGATDEIVGRLTTVLGGGRPAAIAVRAEPDEGLVLINQNFAGRGQVETREYPPGTLSVAVSAEDYLPTVVETELFPGEYTEISVMLNPVQYGEVHINVPESRNASVYRGARYVGEAPLSLWLPVDQLDYFTVETRRGESAKAVFHTPETTDETYSFSLKTKTSPPAGQRQVNRTRNMYYWAWGGTWITGIAAWVTSGVYTAQSEAVLRSGNPELAAKADQMNYIRIGSLILFGAAIVYEGYRMVRYLFTASGDSTPIIKEDNRKK